MANRLKVENGLSVTKMLLCQLIGVDKSEFDIAFDDFPSAVSPLDYYVAPETGLENRAESKLLDKSVEAAKLQLRMKRGENLPSVEKDTDFGMIFASVSVPISSWWGGSHAIKREKIKKQQAENTRQDSREMMLVEIEVKWNDLQEAYQQVLLSENLLPKIFVSITIIIRRGQSLCPICSMLSRLCSKAMISTPRHVRLTNRNLQPICRLPGDN